MISQTIVLLLAIMPAAPLQTRYPLGELPMTDEQVQALKSKGVSFAKYSKGLKVIPPLKFQNRWMPKPHPVGQDGVGSCVGFAWAYALKSCQEGVETQTVPEDPDRYFSPAFIYSQRETKPKHGMSHYQAIEILLQQGCATWAAMPYDTGKVDVEPTDRQRLGACPYQAASPMIVTPSSSYNIKIMLAQELPVVLSTNVTTEFMDIKGDEVFKDFDPSISRGGTPCAWSAMTTGGRQYA